MKKNTLLSGMILLSLLSGDVRADASVIMEDMTHHVQVRSEHVTRLSELITSSELPANTWWQGAVIATPSATLQAEQQKRDVLARLTACETDATGADKWMLQSVVQQLKSIAVTGRQFVALDPDVIRAIPSADRPLQGEYHLYTEAKPSTVLLLGAVSNPGVISWRPGTSVGEYLNGRTHLAGADKNTLRVIHPDGHITAAPVAYWNARHREAEPGSILWVGFDTCRTAGSEHLQDDILTLLTHRIPH